MKDLKTYLLSLYEAEDEPNLDAADDGSDEDKESKEDEEKKELTRRGNIKFTIWKEPDKKVTWINDNDKYQKIEYKYEDKDKDIHIDFLLGFKDKSWKLWIGKIGALSYDDDPYCDFETSSFKEGILAALDKVTEFVDNVEEDPQNWVQFYKKI